MSLPARRRGGLGRALISPVRGVARSAVLFLSMIMWALARAFGTPKIEDPPPKNPVVQREEEG